MTAESSVIDKDSATVASALSNDQIVALPLAQEYRDLVKLIPGVQYTQDTVRGPSAGGSGQDNVYLFDGVNVTLPQYGTLSAEPASHDIAQVTTTKGGARAVDFNRAGGFSIDSVSKSGTSQYHGELSYQLQTKGMAAELTSGAQSRYEQDRDWLNASLGGPILKDRLYFFGSYYRPTKTRSNAANLYGDLPGYDYTRNEGFGKLTFTPTKTILLNASYRESKAVETGAQYASNVSATTGTGNESRLKIFTADGSWVINPKSFATAKYTHFANPTQGTPDYTADVNVSTASGYPARHQQPRHPGPVHGPGARERAQPTTTHSSSRSSTATATCKTAPRWAAASSATGCSSTTTTSTGTRSRSPTT